MLLTIHLNANALFNIKKGNRFSVFSGLVYLILLFSPSLYLQAQSGAGPRLECSFGDQGVRLIAAPFSCYQVTDIEVYQNGTHQGKMVVSFDICDVSGDYDFGVARFHPDGLLDQTFGDAGFVGPIDVRTNDRAVKVLIQDDDKIVIVGNTDQNGCAGGSSAGLMIVRLNVDGTLDNTFSGDGKMHEYFILNPGGCNTNLCYFYDALLQPDGKIVACGTIGGRGGNHSDITAGVARINTNGSVDKRKRINYSNTNGGQSGQSEAFHRVAMQGDKVVVAGVLNGNKIITARLTSTFGTDNSFSSDGKEEFQPEGNVSYSVKGLDVQSNNKLLIGYQANLSTNDYHITRRNNNGGKDNGYGTSGIASISGNSTSEQLVGMEIVTGNNDLYIFGSTPDKDYQVRRLEDDGSVDDQFGYNGDMSLETPSEVGDVSCGALQPDGQLILAGGYNVITMVRVETGNNKPACNPIFPISASCKDLTVTINSNSTFGLTASEFNNGSFAVVGIQSFSVSPFSVSCANVGTLQATLTVYDDNSNTDQCTSNLTVRDGSAPTILCPGNQTAVNNPGDCGKVVSYFINASDACSSVTLSQTDGTGFTNGDEFPVGVTQQSYEAEDTDGNKAFCNFTVTVTDAENPVITCPADVVQSTPANGCSDFVTYPNATATDNCSVSSISHIAGPSSGALFRSPTTSVVTMRARDAAGNVADCSFNISLVDDVPPTLNCPTSIIQASDPNTCDATVTYPTPTTSDNCGTPTLTRIAGLASGSIFPANITSGITYQAEDAAGNTTTCSFSITINDSTPPTISCPAHIVQANDPGVCEAVVTYAAPTTGDNCSNETLARISGLASGSAFPANEVSTVIFETTDGAGNTATCSFTITVNDTTAPSITCPANIQVDNDQGVCEAVVSYQVPLTSDNCIGETAARIGGLASGAAFPVATTTITYEVTDVAGNTAQCSFDITVSDTLLPTIACPANILQANDQGVCEAVVTYHTPTTSDACGGETAVRTAGLASGSAFPANETTTITYEVTDLAGNTTSCSFTVTIQDTLAPTITCPANIIQANDPGVCEAVVNYDAPTTYDNCGDEVLAMVSGKPSGATCQVGSVETTVYEVTDVAGNTATCSFTITVNDSTPPVITCPANIAVDNRTDQCNALVSYNDPTTSDNCPGETYARIGGLISGSAFPANETSTVTYEATDAAGNTSFCSFTITVTDTTRPSIICPADISVSNDVGVCGAEVTYPLTASDNCTFNVAQIDLTTLTSGDTYPVGTTDQAYEVTDASGNTATCSFTITVTDDEPITITCPGTLVRNTDPGTCDHTAVGADLDLAGSVDNCAVASVTNDLTGTSSLAGYVFSKGRTTVSWLVEDMHGNTSTCVHDVRIRDREVPVFDNCPDDTTIVVPSLTTGAFHTWSALTATDNCDNPNQLTISGFPLSGSFFSVGTTTVTWLGTDRSNNDGICEFDVTVEEENGDVPDGWTFENIGTGATGVTTFDPQTGILIIQSSGGTIGSSADNVVGACLESSDATIDFRARVTPPGAGYYDQAGLMMRQSTDPNAATFSMVLTGTSVPTMLYRATAGGFPVATSGATASSPYWLRLYKSGATVTGYASPDGINWTMIYTYSSTLSGTMELCLVSVTSGAQGNATFDNISVNGVAPRFGDSAGAGVLLTGIDAKAYPNPFEDYLNVEGFVPKGSEEVTIQVYNQMGQLIHHTTDAVDWKGEFNTRLSLDGLSSGMYIVEVTCANKRAQVKVVRR